MKFSLATSFLILFSFILDVETFQMPPNARARGTIVGGREAATARAFREEKPKSHFLLSKFKTYTGELIQPYSILGVQREADRREIRLAYIELSKVYHPDAVRHRDILPGSCKSFEEGASLFNAFIRGFLVCLFVCRAGLPCLPVSLSPMLVLRIKSYSVRIVREQWEKIKLSYEILSDKKTRLRYDRADVIADPSAAIKRAAGKAVRDGATNFRNGLFDVGSKAFNGFMTGIRKDER